MAPESISERLYTTASDVWSFGIVCWEVFSLGDAPYAGMTAEQVVISLSKGYRMQRPALCPLDVFV